MNKSAQKQVQIVSSLKSTLSMKERQEILNNGCAGMRSILFYLDTLAGELDKLGKLQGKKTAS